MFQKDDRVELVYTSDPYTRLEPGALGTVRRVGDNAGYETIDVRWDSGSTLSMIPDSGDVIRKVTD